MLQHLQALHDMDKTRARFVNKKEAKFCIFNGNLYWKELGGVMLKCVNEQEENNLIEEFHAGECGVHHYWNTTMNKIMRV